jgi:hypothetical protein
VLSPAFWEIEVKIRWTTIQLGLALVAASASAVAADLKNELSADAFRAAGLHQLSEAELARLNELVSVVVAKQAAAQSEAAPAVASTAPAPTSSEWKAPEPKREEAKDTIETELAESFSGSRRGTRIELANGQVWEQTDDVAVSGSLRDRRVKIMPAIFDKWKMRFFANNQFVRVKRVK